MNKKFNNRSGAKCCCKGCTERYPLCHDSCPKYKEFRAEIEKISEEARKVRFIERMAEPNWDKIRRRKR